MLFVTQDVNFPKFLEMDLPLFEGIISDLFPGRKRPALDYGALNSVMKVVIQAKGLQPHPFFTTKVPFKKQKYASNVFVLRFPMFLFLIVFFPGVTPKRFSDRGMRSAPAFFVCLP